MLPVKFESTTSKFAARVLIIKPQKQSLVSSGTQNFVFYTIQSFIYDTQNLRVSCSVYRYSCISIHEYIKKGLAKYTGTRKYIKGILKIQDTRNIERLV